MPNDTTVLLFIIILLLIVAVTLLANLARKSRTVTYVLSLDPTFREQVAEIGNGVRHYADVSAVLGLLEQIEERPEVVERLREYSETIRTAAWLHYFDRLGHDLQQAQKSLSDAHQSTLGFGYASYDKEQAIKRAQQHVDNLRAKLDAAIAASGQKVGPRSA